jgi:3'(2'), 5'-bisphosphate nucleotidase
MASATDHALARRIATSTGEVLLALRREHVASSGAGSDRTAGRGLADAGDRAAQTHLAAALAEAVPDDAVLSEEAADIGHRASADRVWIIDPVDGTREYADPPRTDWAVHVALWERTAGDGDGQLAAGAVALPALGITLATDEAPVLPPRGAGPPRILVSRSRPPAQASAVAEAIGGTLVPMGSAGAKVMAVVRGEAEAYVHAGGQYEWDSAAPVAVALAAGLHASRLDGTPMRYNAADPYLPDLVIARAELAPQVLRALGVGHGA